MLWYLPKFKLINTAEDATHNMHNLYTLRGPLPSRETGRPELRGDGNHVAAPGSLNPSRTQPWSYPLQKY